MIHLSFQSESQLACGHPLGALWLLSAEVGSWWCGVTLRFQKEKIRLQLKLILFGRSRLTFGDVLQRHLLEKEDIKFDGGNRLDLERCRWRD
jgi:hypothetical protein